MQTRGRWILLPENRAARQAVDRVHDCICRRSARRVINPLFLHGPAGTGKSRLLVDLIGQLNRCAPDLSLVMLQASDIRPGSSGETHDDIAAARSADLVIIEDLQHLGAPAIELLTGLLDRCRARQRQLICTASAGPAQLTPLPRRLTSRLAQGLVVRLELLSPSSRRAYLRQLDGVSDLSFDILDWLVQHTPGSGRQLEGALTRLRILTVSLGRPLRLDEAADVFRQDSVLHAPTVERITRRVGRYFHVSPPRLCSRRRSRQVMVPRQVSMYLTRQLTPLSLEQIGDYFGGRDHSTVLHACRKVEQILTTDKQLASAIHELQAELR
jgi:chromosomal replication initiator protein